jgi:hypothetical protein
MKKGCNSMRDKPKLDYALSNFEKLFALSNTHE